jgi:hypothetical protein
MSNNTLVTEQDPTTKISLAEDLNNSLSEVSPIIKDHGELLLCPWDDLEEEDMGEIQKALITAEAMPSCLAWGAGSLLYAAYDDRYQEYFLGVVSEGDLMKHITPFDLNQEFCFGAFWSTRPESVRIVSKFLNQSNEFPLKGDLKSEHVEAIKSLIEIVKKIKGDDCDYESEEN